MQFQEFTQDLDARIAASKITGFWKPEDKERWLNKSVIRACNYAPWKFLSKHASQLIELNLDGTIKENYFLPFDFKPGGMILLKVYDPATLKGKKHFKVDIDAFHAKTYPYERVYTIVGDEYFVNLAELIEDSSVAAAQMEGKVMDIFYKRRPVKMVEPTDEPITPEEMDEAIIKFAFAICLTKTPGRSAEAVKEINEANSMLQQIRDREDEEPSSVYKGQATSTRWQ